MSALKDLEEKKCRRENFLFRFGSARIRKSGKNEKKKNGERKYTNKSVNIGQRGITVCERTVLV